MSRAVIHETFEGPEVGGQIVHGDRGCDDVVLHGAAQLFSNIESGRAPTPYPRNNAG